MTELSVGVCVRYGWETFKKRPWFLIGALLVATLITNAPQYLLGFIDPEGTGFVAFAISIGLMALGIAVQLVLLRFWIKAHDSVETMKYEDAMPPRPFWKYVGGSAASGLVVILGLLLLIVPGIIAMLAFYFTLYLVIERQMWPIEAMKESARITKGNRIRLLLLLLALFAINFLATLPFLVAVGLFGFLTLVGGSTTVGPFDANLLGLPLLIGLLVTIPVSMLASVHAYRILLNKAGAPASAPAPASA